MLADIVEEFTEPVVVEQYDEPKAPTWKLFMDGSSNHHNSGTGIILISREGHKFHSALRFGFTSSNNEAEYEALLAGLHLS